ncbi:TnsA endonuclease N-terminal domain-containing protein [Rhodoferax sp. U11-2br]|uniref:TnsA endonuclease N-terminal domain-containing protein n=1 Tax=Rhodoferax sp. U11-2br TaxID=2838878 RepID=UPI0020371300|nr:TnsA endonuclease N-terminal domain-containing protein [Rhodoferax sp. U11-2br]
MVRQSPFFINLLTNANLAGGGIARLGVKGKLMRTQKRFTPTLLARFVRQGRGTGTYIDYLPWHRVGRGDPASLGRSHLMMWRQRQRELLSDGEWVGLLFSTMINDLADVREQQKLSLEDGPFELALYDVRHGGKSYPGTLNIARQLGFKHPRVNGDGASDDWVMTTDQLLVIRMPSGQLELLAVAYKPDGRKLTKRNRELLAIEKAYWNARDVVWLLITPDLFSESAGVTLRRAAPWGLGVTVAASDRAIAVHVVNQTLGHTFTYTLDVITAALGNKDLAQRAFWQAVWTGVIPMDLRTGWRPHLPIKLLSQDDFVALNPVASRRTSWN